VKAGQLLAEMDPVDLDQRVAALDASIARAASAAPPPRRSGAMRWRAAKWPAINARRYVDLARRNSSAPA
jgi:HlyD family secretion protein